VILEVRKRTDGTIELRSADQRNTIVLTKEQARTLANALIAATK